ncbi:MAG TPA: TetR family transcriptional regulator [Acidimicrobiales bacterium]|jgi:AcrR family transcriptional regulator|nr:TetR family transcriptional regulator [Acidimicrobiales bacterium]
MAGRGRRPGHADTRAAILASARAVFYEQGYAGASLRAIARRAAVDPALVHHYFADKSALYIEMMDLPIDPKAVKDEVGAGGFTGERLIDRFLAQWERGPGAGSPAFLSLAQAMAASPQIADGMREFIIERVGLEGPFGGDEDEETRMKRRALVGSQLLGIAWARYVMRMEPIASASRAQVARWAGPTIDRYVSGGIDD